MSEEKYKGTQSYNRFCPCGNLLGLKSNLLCTKCTEEVIGVVDDSVLRLKQAHLQEYVDLLQHWQYNAVTSDRAYPYIFRMFRQIAGDAIKGAVYQNDDSPEIKSLLVKLHTVANWNFDEDWEDWQYDEALKKIQQYLEVNTIL